MCFEQPEALTGREVGLKNQSGHNGSGRRGLP